MDSDSENESNNNNNNMNDDESNVALRSKRRRITFSPEATTGADSRRPRGNNPAVAATATTSSNNDDSLQDSPISNTNNNSRAERMAQLAAARRRRAQQQELRQNDDEDTTLQFAGETEQYSEVRNPLIVNDDDDNDNDDVIENDPNDDDDVEEEDGEDLLENMDRDYQRIAALDTYGTEGMDETEYDALDMDQREAAERELARRDRERGVGRRRDGFYGLLDADEVDEDADARNARRGMFRRTKRRTGGDGDDGDEPDGDGDDSDDDGDVTDEEDLDGEDMVNLEAFDVPLREWIAQDRTRREIQRRFRKLLRHFVVTTTNNNGRHQRRGNGLYEQKIRSMCAANLSTLQISYLHIMEYEPVLAYWLADAPADMLLVLNEAATRHTLFLFPSYNAIKSEIHVRIADVPILDSLRDLRQSHLNCLIKVHGVVTRRSAVFPQLQLAYYTCLSCKNIQGPFRVQGGSSSNNNNPSNLHQPTSCPNCDVAAFRLHPTLSQYRNVQRLNLQESPGSVPPGRAPRTKEVLLLDDLIDTVRPGEDAEITGIYEHTFDSTLTFKSGFPVFSTSITANHVCKREDASSASNLSEHDVRQILELARDPKIGERIVKSIAPSIYGHDFCKMALAMSLFAGVPKNINDKHRIRGDVNVLLLGDPGTAKSQLLKYAQNTAPRAVYSTGKGASAVGLTASVHKDPITREWTLEGGALVLADKGVCLIDEFDKMNEQDRTSIHEAMEQQSISISKAGIVTSLQARCSVIAAANPIGGRYDSSNTLSDNVELTDPILQRFDILCVLQDTVDPVADERLAKFVTGSHMRSIPTRELANDEDPANLIPPDDGPNDHPERHTLIPQQLLRKYIQYARTNVRPVLRSNAFDKEKVASLYVALRRESAASGGVPIAVRHVESIMRMSEAHAKMHLREYVRDDDVNASIQMMLGSFIDSQKFSVKRSLRRNFAKYLTNGEDRAHLLLHILQDMFRKEQLYQVIRQRQQSRTNNSQSQYDDPIDSLEVPLDEFESRARERRIYDVTEFCKGTTFQEAGYSYDEMNRIVSRSML